jgi:hypothetical protein
LLPRVCCAVRWISLRYERYRLVMPCSGDTCVESSHREDVWEIGGMLHASLTSEIGRGEWSAACFGRFEYWKELPEQWCRETSWEMYAGLTFWRFWFDIIHGFESYKELQENTCKCEYLKSAFWHFAQYVCTVSFVLNQQQLHNGSRIFVSSCGWCVFCVSWQRIILYLVSLTYLKCKNSSGIFFRV